MACVFEIPCDSFQCKDCHVWQHHPVPIDSGEVSASMCAYCGGVLIWRTDNNWKLVEQE